MVKRDREEDEFKAVKKAEWLPPHKRAAALKAASLVVNFGDLSAQLKESTTQSDSMSAEIITREKDLRRLYVELGNAFRIYDSKRWLQLDRVLGAIEDEINVEEKEIEEFTESRRDARRRSETLQSEIDRVVRELGKNGRVLITHADDVQPLIRLRDDHGFRPQVYCQELELSDDLRSHGFDPIHIL